MAAIASVSSVSKYVLGPKNLKTIGAGYFIGVTSQEDRNKLGVVVQDSESQLHGLVATYNESKLCGTSISDDDLDRSVMDYLLKIGPKMFSFDSSDNVVLNTSLPESTVDEFWRCQSPDSVKGSAICGRTSFIQDVSDPFIDECSSNIELQNCNKPRIRGSRDVKVRGGHSALVNRSFRISILSSFRGPYKESYQVRIDDARDVVLQGSPRIWIKEGAQSIGVTDAYDMVFAGDIEDITVTGGRGMAFNSEHSHSIFRDGKRFGG